MLEDAAGEVQRTAAIERLLGLAVFGEVVAAKTYSRMARLRPEHADELRAFAVTEVRHSEWFREVAAKNEASLDEAFARERLGYLIEQVEEHYAAGDFDALAVLQGLLVECLAIATYEPFLRVAAAYDGALDAFTRALADEREHVAWVTAFLRGRFSGDPEAFLGLVQRVNERGVDCVGGTLIAVADALGAVGLSGSSCAAAMMDEYATLLEAVGVDEARANQAVVRVFVPLVKARAPRQPS